MFRTSFVRHQEDYIVHAVLYCMWRSRWRCV